MCQTWGCPWVIEGEIDPATGELVVKECAEPCHGPICHSLSTKQGMFREKPGNKDKFLMPWQCKHHKEIVKSKNRAEWTEDDVCSEHRPLLHPSPAEMIALGYTATQLPEYSVTQPGYSVPPRGYSVPEPRYIGYQTGLPTMHSEFPQTLAGRVRYPGMIIPHRSQEIWESN